MGSFAWIFLCWEQIQAVQDKSSGVLAGLLLGVNIIAQHNPLDQPPHLNEPYRVHSHRKQVSLAGLLIIFCGPAAANAATTTTTFIVHVFIRQRPLHRHTPSFHLSRRNKIIRANDVGADDVRIWGQLLDARNQNVWTKTTTQIVIKFINDS